MYWYDHGMNGWGYTIMTLIMIAFWALVAVAVVALLRRPGTAPHHPAAPTGQPSTAEQLLAERFARGEIDEDEYHQRLAVLQRGSGPQKTG